METSNTNKYNGFPVPHSMKKVRDNNGTSGTNERTYGDTARDRISDLTAFEHRFSFLQERRDAFFFVFGGKTDGEKVNFASEPFVEVRA